ncbi:MAG: hypothetical protein ABGZ35_04725 [Planctomycetaceae bacterium]
MIDGHQIEKTLAELGTTHVIWLPDTTLGQWEEALEASAAFELLRVCREGEAWPLAAGLYLGGRSPLVMMQTTGLFESGDALRNVLFDLRVPLFALIGYRSYDKQSNPTGGLRSSREIRKCLRIRQLAGMEVRGGGCSSTAGTTMHYPQGSDGGRLYAQGTGTNARSDCCISGGIEQLSQGQGRLVSSLFAQRNHDKCRRKQTAVQRINSTESLQHDRAGDYCTSDTESVFGRQKPRLCHSF